MDGAGGPTRSAVVADAAATVASTPRLEAYPREQIEALVSRAMLERAELREALDEARRDALDKQTPAPMEVVPRADADGALSALEGELVQLRAQLAAAQAHLAATPAAPPVPVVVPLEAASPLPHPAGVPVVPVVPVSAPLPVELQPTAVVPAVVAAPPVVQRVVVERAPFSRATGLLQVVTWSVIVAVVLIVLLAWFA